MENKILVEVKVPATGEVYDIFIPLTSRLSEVLALVATAVEELSSDQYQPDEDVVFCDATDGSIYDINKEVAELGLENGSRLLLI